MSRRTSRNGGEHSVIFIPHPAALVKVLPLTANPHIKKTRCRCGAFIAFTVCYDASEVIAMLKRCAALRLPEEWFEELAKRARRNERTVSQELRLAVRKHLRLPPEKSEINLESED